MRIRSHFLLFLLPLVGIGCSPKSEGILNEVELRQALRQVQLDQQAVNKKMETLQRSHDSEELRALDQSLTDLFHSTAILEITVGATLEKRKAQPVVSRSKVLE